MVKPASPVKSTSLHFYPGEKLVVFIKSGTVKLKGEAWGGPSSAIKSHTMNMGPTDAGTFVIYSVAPYRTKTWNMSKILWGTRLKDTGADVLFEESPSNWSSALSKAGVTRDQLISEYSRLYGEKRIPDKWVFNDFGPIAIRYFKDLNNNKKLDKNEALSGEMFHTTPDNEAQARQGESIVMQESHGCIHLKPNDRDIFQAEGAFASGMPLIIHRYDEKFTP